MTDLVLGFAAEFLLILALLGLAFLALYLPLLIVARLFLRFGDRNGFIVRRLVRPIGPSISGQGEERTAVSRAFRRWAMRALKAALTAIALGVALLYMSFVLFVAEIWWWIVFLAMCAAVIVFLVCGGVCAFLLVRLSLPRTPGTPAPQAPQAPQAP